MKTKIILAVWLGWATGAFALEEKFTVLDETGFVPGWAAQSIDWSGGQGRLNLHGGAERTYVFPTNLAAGAEAEVVLYLRQAPEVLESLRSPIDLGQPGLGDRLGLQVEDDVGIEMWTPLVGDFRGPLTDEA